MSNKQPEFFTEKYYNKDYFATPNGKSCVLPNGSIKSWSYGNPTGNWGYASYIAKSWKKTFNAKEMLDVGAGRGTFIGYARDENINAVGFDFSSWAVSDEGRFSKCQDNWLIRHDATSYPWPYDSQSFDFVVCLDLMEHIYEEDIGVVIEELYRVCRPNGTVFLQIAVSPYTNYSLKKGETVPDSIVVLTLTGHVLVQSREWWLNKLEIDGWKHDQIKLDEFYKNVNPPFPPESAWVKNLMAVMRRI